MIKKLSFTRTGSSANIDFYETDDPAWCAEVLIDSWHKVDGKIVVKRPSEFTITVREHDAGGGWMKRLRFSYRPLRNPQGLHLPNMTVSRLVRAELKKKEGL